VGSVRTGPERKKNPHPCKNRRDAAPDDAPLMIDSPQMESPVRIELPKLSHLHLLELLLPLVPGVVVTTGLTLSSSPIASKFWLIALGYKSKLALALALSYAIGLATITIMQSANDLVMRLVERPAPGEPWGNTYGRRIAATFVGAGLSPKMPSSMSPKEVDDFVKYVSGLSGAKSLKIEFTNHYDSLKKLEESLKKYADTAARIPPDKAQQIKEILDKSGTDISRISSTFEEQKQALAKTEEGIRLIVSDVEWLSLYNALELLPSPNSPYLAFSLLMTSLQSASIGGLWLVIRYKELQSSVAGVFWALVLIATSRGIWLNFRLNHFYRNLSSPQLAAMLEKITQQSHQDPEPK
jgi:hypothetical protein